LTYRIFGPLEQVVAAVVILGLGEDAQPAPRYTDGVQLCKPLLTFGLVRSDLTTTRAVTQAKIALEMPQLLRLKTQLRQILATRLFCPG